MAPNYLYDLHVEGQRSLQWRLVAPVGTINFIEGRITTPPPAPLCSLYMMSTNGHNKVSTVLFIDSCSSLKDQSRPRAQDLKKSLVRPLTN